MQNTLPQNGGSARAAQVGAFIFGSAARLGHALLARMGLIGGGTWSWRTGVIYGRSHVAVLAETSLNINRMGHIDRWGVELKRIVWRASDAGSDAASAPVLQGSLAPRLREITLNEEDVGLGMAAPGRWCALVAFTSSGHSGSDVVNLLGTYADSNQALSHFRETACRMCSETLGPVAGSPWTIRANRQAFLSRWVPRVLKVALALLVLSWVASGLTSAARMASASGAALRIPVASSNASSAAGAATAALDAQAAQAVESAAAAAERAASAGAPMDAVLADSWNRLSADQQKTLLALAKGDPSALQVSHADPSGQSVQSGAANDRILSDKEMAAVMRVASLGIHPGKKGMPAAIVFEDPLCPSCREFAKAAIPEDIPVAVVPIAFQQGATAWASKALCSGDVTKAWVGLMAGGAPSAKETCVTGDATITRNNDLFQQLGFNATPTLVAPNGRVMVGAPDAASFAAWYRANLK
jgi:hypothetical protein